MTNDDIANSEQGEDFENKRTKYKIFQSITCNIFFYKFMSIQKQDPNFSLAEKCDFKFYFPYQSIQRVYTVPSFITTTVTDDGMASGPATLLQKWKYSAQNELPHIF